MYVYVYVLHICLDVFIYICRSSEDVRNAKLGVKEAVSHELVMPYQVYIYRYLDVDT
jgi:hypothetical protein